MTDMFIKHMAAPKAHIVLGINFEEKNEGKKLKKEEEKDESGVRLIGVWTSDIPSPLQS
jgi:hypothetical protein